MKRISTVKPKSSDPVQWGYLRPDQFLDHLTVIKTERFFDRFTTFRSEKNSKNTQRKKFEKIKSEKKVGAPFFMSGFATDSEG